MTKLGSRPTVPAPPVVPASRWSLRTCATRRAAMRPAPHSQTASSTPPAARCREIPIPTSSRPGSCVAHETEDAPKRSRKPPKGSMKLSKVATQIQYFQVALLFHADVSSQAARQTIEAKRKCTSRKYTTGPTCSCIAFASAAPGSLLRRFAFETLQVLQRDSTCLEEVRDQQARRAAKEVEQITH